MEERWVYIKGRGPVKIKTTSEYMNDLIRANKKVAINESKQKPYLSEKYTHENVNDYFEKIETYEQLKEFEEDFFNKIKMMPLIVPKKHANRQWVAFLDNIDNNNVKFSVLSEDTPYGRKTKSSMKNFIKNYMIWLE